MGKINFENKKYSNVVLIVLSLLVIYSTVTSTINYIDSPKIGFINSGLLIEKYPGALKAKAELEKKSSEWKKNIQTLETELNQLNQDMLKNGSKWSKQVLLAKEDQMRIKQTEYNKYARAVNEKAQQLEQDLLKPVYSELNLLIEDFGKEKGYDIVLGTLSGGNILYADKAADLTEKFLEYVKNK